ncbi:unnamed protein product [Urochloa humidicola]
MHRGVCTTDGGSTLKFVDVVASKQQQQPHDNNTFTIFTYTLKKAAKGGRMRLEKDTVAPMMAEELWGLKTPSPIPNAVPLFPVEHGEAPDPLFPAVGVHRLHRHGDAGRGRHGCQDRDVGVPMPIHQRGAGTS